MVWCGVDDGLGGGHKVDTGEKGGIGMGLDG